MSARLSPDGMYYWDGRQWISTVSPDGRYRWNGSAWVAIQGDTYGSPGYYQAPRTVREPTSWTRPLQYAVVAWYAISAVYTLSLPFWLAGTMAQVMNQSIQRQAQLYPQATPPPVEFTSSMTSLITAVLWVSAVFGLAVCAVAIIGALMRWTWAYYVILVLLGFGTLGLLDVFSALMGSAMSSATGFMVPTTLYWFGFILAIPDTALFVWMLVAVVRYGPWAQRKVAVS